MIKFKKMHIPILALTLCCLFSSEAFAMEVKINSTKPITKAYINPSLLTKENEEEIPIISLNSDESSSVQADTDNKTNIIEENNIDENTVPEGNVSNEVDNEVSDTSETDVTDDSNDLSSDTEDTDNESKIYEVTSNSNFSDTMTATQETHLYVIDTTNMDKITSIVQFNEANTFSMTIYKYTDESGFEEVAASPYNIFTSTMDSLSVIPDGGIYAIAVTAENPGDFIFRVEESTSHSAYEPNDNPFQAKVAVDQLYITDTFDNTFDQDWVRIDVSEDCEYRITTSTNNCTLDNLYIVDFNNGNITPITDQSTDISLAKGTYYIYAAGTMSSDDNSYSINMLPKDSIVSKVDISSITSGSGSSKVSYAEGSQYQVSDSMTVSGIAYNESNTVAKNALVSIWLKTHAGDLCYKAAYTDETGAFTATITLSAASGSKSYFDPYQHTKYYYDVIPLVVMNYNYDAVSSNVSSVYHFAKSEYVAPVPTNSQNEKLTASATPIASDYCSISGRATDANGIPLANRRVVLVTNFNGVAPQYSYIDASETSGLNVTTDENGYYKFYAVHRSSYLERYNPGRDCSYYVYLDEGKNYSFDELSNYAKGINGSNWPFYWIIDARRVFSSSIRAYAWC